MPPDIGSLPASLAFRQDARTGAQGSGRHRRLPGSARARRSGGAGADGLHPDDERGDVVVGAAAAVAQQLLVQQVEQPARRGATASCPRSQAGSGKNSPDRLRVSAPGWW
ncbi:hypothetical protein [Streptomyces sp. NBC_01198]|uniref:hypothetical protein n=1 Tax=Streptomyces sp. NBC_01198 TaxID=2903769 RepID=UPI002E15C41C|nr:hypothetical protein OG702_01035 [Streptomyces sp. NBC_01198]